MHASWFATMHVHKNVHKTLLLSGGSFVYQLLELWQLYGCPWKSCIIPHYAENKKAHQVELNFYYPRFLQSNKERRFMLMRFMQLVFMCSHVTKWQPKKVCVEFRCSHVSPILRHLYLVELLLRFRCFHVLPVVRHIVSAELIFWGFHKAPHSKEIHVVQLIHGSSYKVCKKGGAVAKVRVLMFMCSYVPPILRHMVFISRTYKFFKIFTKFEWKKVMLQRFMQLRFRCFHVLPVVRHIVSAELFL